MVWAFNYAEKGVQLNETIDPDPFEIDNVKVFFPDHIYPFLSAQMAVFTVHPNNNGSFKDFSEWADGHTKIEIPSSDFNHFRYMLNRLGINWATLFPGLEGLGRRLSYEHTLDEDEKNT